MWHIDPDKPSDTCASSQPCQNPGLRARYDLLLLLLLLSLIGINTGSHYKVLTITEHIDTK